MLFVNRASVISNMTDVEFPFTLNHQRNNTSAQYTVLSTILVFFEVLSDVNLQLKQYSLYRLLHICIEDW